MQEASRAFASQDWPGARAVGHAHRVLHRALQRGVETEILPRNVASVIKPPKVEALISSGPDVLTVSRRLGHGSPVVILTTYAHLFEKTDTAAANAIEAALRTGIER